MVTSSDAVATAARGAARGAAGTVAGDVAGTAAAAGDVAGSAGERGGEADVAGGLLDAARALRRALCGIEPSGFAADAARALCEELSSTEKTCAAARLLLAARAVACGAHRDAGVPDPARWMARQGGTTSAEARQGLELARALDACEATKAAMLAGEVSVPQAKEITKARHELGTCEADLLEAARSGDLGTLRDWVRERRAACSSPEELHRRQVAQRRFRHWRDALGMVCFEGALPP
jgi:hypothetical protein